jgi:hypothetical protein
VLHYLTHLTNLSTFQRILKKVCVYHCSLEHKFSITLYIISTSIAAISSNGELNSAKVLGWLTYTLLLRHCNQNKSQKDMWHIAGHSISMFHGSTRDWNNCCIIFIKLPVVWACLVRTTKFGGQHHATWTLMHGRQVTSQCSDVKLQSLQCLHRGGTDYILILNAWYCADQWSIATKLHSDMLCSGPKTISSPKCGTTPVSVLTQE